MAGTFASRQNEDAQLTLLKSRSQVYFRAKWLMALQMTVAIPFPVAMAVLGLMVRGARPYVACASLLLTGLEVVILDRVQKAQLKKAAKLGERFDCTVLDLPWDSFGVGSPVSPHEVHEAADAYARRGGNVSRLQDWYPKAAAMLPIHLGRLICQRTNL